MHPKTIKDIWPNIQDELSQINYSSYTDPYFTWNSLPFNSLWFSDHWVTLCKQNPTLFRYNSKSYNLVISIPIYHNTIYHTPILPVILFYKKRCLKSSYSFFLIFIFLVSYLNTSLTWKITLKAFFRVRRVIIISWINQLFVWAIKCESNNIEDKGNIFEIIS